MYAADVGVQTDAKQQSGHQQLTRLPVPAVAQDKEQPTQYERQRRLIVQRAPAVHEVRRCQREEHGRRDRQQFALEQKLCDQIHQHDVDNARGDHRETDTGFGERHTRTTMAMAYINIG